MKLEDGKYYKTQNGTKAYVVGEFPERHGLYRVLAMVYYNMTGVTAMWFDRDGKCIDSSSIVAEWRDPIEVTGWVNVYPEPNRFISYWDTKKAADSAASPHRVACIEVKGKENG